MEQASVLRFSRDMRGRRVGAEGYYFSLTVDFKNDSKDVREALPCLARHAAEHVARADKGGARRPGAVAALAVGSRVFFASTLTGSNEFLDLAGPEARGLGLDPAKLAPLRDIIDALDAERRGGHSHKRRCAEIMALAQALTLDDRFVLPPTPDARFAVCWTKGRFKTAAPCGPKDGCGYGCSQVLERSGIPCVGDTEAGRDSSERAAKSLAKKALQPPQLGAPRPAPSCLTGRAAEAGRDSEPRPGLT